MGKAQPKPTKVIDEFVQFRCVSGLGKIREEVWQDHQGNVVKYNLTFINHQLYSKDNERVLGYDNAHGQHERHFKGSIEPVSFTGYAALFERFLTEVRELKGEKA